MYLRVWRDWLGLEGTIWQSLHRKLNRNCFVKENLILTVLIMRLFRKCQTKGNCWAKHQKQHNTEISQVRAETHIMQLLHLASAKPFHAVLCLLSFLIWLLVQRNISWCSQSLKKKVGDKIISYQKFLPLLHLLLSPSLFSSFQLPSVCLSFSSSFCLSRGQPVDGKLISVSRNPCGCTFYTHLLCVCVCAAMFWGPEEENFESGGLCPLVQQTLLPSCYRDLHGG